MNGTLLSVSTHTTRVGRGPSTGLTTPLLRARCPMTALKSTSSSRTTAAAPASLAPAPPSEEVFPLVAVAVVMAAGGEKRVARCTFVTAEVRSLVQWMQAWVGGRLG